MIDTLSILIHLFSSYTMCDLEYLERESIIFVCSIQEFAYRVRAFCIPLFLYTYNSIREMGGSCT